MNKPVKILLLVEIILITLVIIFKPEQKENKDIWVEIIPTGSVTVDSIRLDFPDSIGRIENLTIINGVVEVPESLFIQNDSASIWIDIDSTDYIYIRRYY